jgi:hypothetical protein
VKPAASRRRAINDALCQYLYLATFIEIRKVFFKKHSINTDIYTRTSIHSYKYTYAHPTSTSISEKLSRLDLEIHEVGHQEHLTVDRDIASH